MPKKEMTCHYCQLILDSYWEFCPRCGNSVRQFIEMPPKEEQVKSLTFRPFKGQQGTLRVVPDLTASHDHIQLWLDIKLVGYLHLGEAGLDLCNWDGDLGSSEYQRTQFEHFYAQGGW